jgi:ribosomal protein S18 acetylase RimI-like enzyme
VEYAIAPGKTADIAELERLWLQMLSHHRGLVGREFPVHADEQSWERARDNYGDWLADSAAILLIARSQDQAEPLGYVVCRLHPGGPTFDLGELRGEIDSLVVDDRARGRGIGTALLNAVRADLNERGIAYCSIGVLAPNTEATKLYERVGFRPWTQELLARTDET